MLIRAVQAAFFVLLWHCVLAQLGSNFQSITVDDGLAQNTVWDVIEDHRGYLWIATADGLNRFDGYQFKHYKHNPADSSTIAGINIFDLYIDSNQTLWVSHDRGMSRYDRVHDRFDNLIKEQVIMVGEGKNGCYWLLGNQSNVYKINGDGAILMTYSFERGTYNFGSVKKAVSMGGFWFMSCPFGLLAIDKENEEVEFLDVPKGFSGAIMALDDRTIFCPGPTSYTFNVQTKQFEILNLNIDLPPSIASTNVLRYNGEILMGSSWGIHVLDSAKLKLKRHVRSFERGKEDSFHYVQTLYVDRAGTLYIGTNGGGMKVSIPSRNKFPLYSTGQVTTDFIKSIAKVGDQLITGQYDHGIVIYDSNSSYRHVEFMKNGNTTSVLALYPLDEERLFLVNGYDLVRFNIKHMREEKRVSIPWKDYGMGYPVIHKVESNLWYLNTDKGLFSFDQNLQIIPLLDLGNHVRGFHVTTHLKMDNQMWIGASHGLTIIEGKELGRTAQLLQNYYVKCITEALNGHVWVATTAGLFLLDEKGNQLARHDISTGLPNDFVYGVLEDDLGHIWISHNKGLSRIDPRTNAYRHFGLGDGLQSNEFNTGAFYKDEQGYLYFGGVGGVNKIDPRRLDVPYRPPKMAINQINLLDEPLASDTSYNELTILRLAPQENTLSFDFSALDIRAAENMRYSYRLLGYDPQWILSGDRHFARYANLPPGDYTFQVRATLEGQSWSDNIRNLRIVIAPPFWQKAWFLVLAGITALLVIGLTVRLVFRAQNAKLRRELEVQHKLELERIRISRDLHDHVGAQLSYLITNMEWMAEHPDQIDNLERQQQLKSLSEAGRQAVATLRQTIWAISQQELSVEDFADRFKQFALKMVEFNPRVKLVFEEQMDGDRQLSPSVALHLFRICQEAFNNALKHAQAGRLTMRFGSSEQRPFTFYLHDDGEGFDVDLAPQNGHYGLRNMRARAAECGADLHIVSECGRGTVVTLEMAAASK